MSGVVDEIIEDVFGSEVSAGDGLEEHAVRVQAVVNFTDPYYENTGETGETVAEALRNSFDNVDVEEIRVLGEIDPTTGILHFEGVDD